MATLVAEPFDDLHCGDCVASPTPRAADPKGRARAGEVVSRDDVRNPNRHEIDHRSHQQYGLADAKQDERPRDVRHRGEVVRQKGQGEARRDGQQSAPQAGTEEGLSHQGAQRDRRVLAPDPQLVADLPRAQRGSLRARVVVGIAGFGVNRVEDFDLVSRVTRQVAGGYRREFEGTPVSQPPEDTHGRRFSDDVHDGIAHFERLAEVEGSGFARGSHEHAPDVAGRHPAPAAEGAFAIGDRDVLAVDGEAHTLGEEHGEEPACDEEPQGCAEPRGDGQDAEFESVRLLPPLPDEEEPSGEPEQRIAEVPSEQGDAAHDQQRTDASADPRAAETYLGRQNRKKDANARVRFERTELGLELMRHACIVWAQRVGATRPAL